MEKAKTRALLEKKAQKLRKTLHKGTIVTFVEEKVSYEGDRHKSYDLVLHPGAVAMIPIDNEGKIVFVKQWRRAVEQILLELPAGCLEIDEEPIDCAGRELREEIGQEASEITPLGGFFTAPGFCNEYIHLFLAQGLKPNPLIGDDTDEIDVISLSVDEAMDQIEEGKIIDAKTIAGIYRYTRRLP